MQAQHVLWAVGGVGNCVHVQVRGVGGQHRTGACVGVDLFEDLLLDGQVFKHRLDHQIGVAELGPVCAGRQQRLGSSDCLNSQLSLGHTALVMLRHPLPTALQSGFILLQQDDLEPGIERADGNAGTHGARTDDGHRRASARRNLESVRELRSLCFGKRQVLVCGCKVGCGAAVTHGGFPVAFLHLAQR